MSVEEVERWLAPILGYDNNQQSLAGLSRDESRAQLTQNLVYSPIIPLQLHTRTYFGWLHRDSHLFPHFLVYHLLLDKNKEFVLLSFYFLSWCCSSVPTGYLPILKLFEKILFYFPIGGILALVFILARCYIFAECSLF